MKYSKVIFWTLAGIGVLAFLSKMMKKPPLPSAVAANPSAYAIGSDTIRGKGRLLAQRWKMVDGQWKWTPMVTAKKA